MAWHTGCLITLTRNGEDRFICPGLDHSSRSKGAIRKHVSHCKAGTATQPCGGRVLSRSRTRKVHNVPGAIREAVLTPSRLENASLSDPVTDVDQSPASALPFLPSHGASVSYPFVDVDQSPAPPTLSSHCSLADSERSLLEQFDLRVEPRLQIIYCMQCGQAVRPPSVRTHILTHRPSCPPLSLFAPIWEANGLSGIV